MRTVAESAVATPAYKRYKGCCDIVQGCTQGFGHSGICRVVQDGPRKRYSTTDKRSRSETPIKLLTSRRGEATLPQLTYDSNERGDVRVTSTETMYIDGRSVASKDFSPTLIEALRPLVEALRHDGNMDCNAQHVYTNVYSATAETYYVVNRQNMCTNISCGDSTMGAMVICAVRLDPSLRNDSARLYAWMHAMKNDGGAVDIWLDKVSDAISKPF